MKNYIYTKGEFVESNSAGIDIFSQSVHYGFGVFEGLRSYVTDNGIKIFKAKEHFERLIKSCKKIGIPFKKDVYELIRISYRLLELNKLDNAYIRPLVTTGRGMDLKVNQVSDITIVAWEWDFYNGNKLLNTCISSHRRSSPKTSPIDAKITGNYINSIMATTEAVNAGFDDAIQLDERGFVAETPGANLFCEKDGKIYTPAASEYILAGITRDTLIKIARSFDIEVIEKNITPEEFKDADSAFLCSTAAEVVGIGSVDHIPFRLNFEDSVGATLQRAYKKLVLDKLSYEVII